MEIPVPGLDNMRHPPNVSEKKIHFYCRRYVGININKKAFKEITVLKKAQCQL